MVDSRIKKAGACEQKEAIKNRLNEAFRARPGLRNKELADYCGISEQSVWKWRRTGGITARNIQLVAKFFDYSPNWLLDDNDRQYQNLNNKDRIALELLAKLPDSIRDEIIRHVRALTKIIGEGVGNDSKYKMLNGPRDNPIIDPFNNRKRA